MSLQNLEFKKDLDMLFKAVLELNNIDECYATINELRAISQRIYVAKMLTDKKVYTEIADATGASTATISRVNKCLNYGQGGYNLVLERMYPKDKQD